MNMAIPNDERSRPITSLLRAGLLGSYLRSVTAGVPTSRSKWLLAFCSATLSGVAASTNIIKIVWLWHAECVLPA
jgi:hypothetical protein